MTIKIEPKIKPVIQPLAQPATEPLQPTTPEKTWGELGLSDDILQAIQQAGYTNPTPVQQKAIPSALEGNDLVVSAQTGTGKTAAFTLPLLQKLKGREGTYALVLAPSREIALQTHETITQLGKSVNVRSVALIGGIDLKIDERALQTYPQVLVATPGRLCDHLERGNLWLDYLEILVLDEADRMLDMGFSDQLNRITKELPASRQSLLFSATFPPTVEKLANKILKNPQKIQIGKKTSAAKTVEQKFIYTDERSKLPELQKIIHQESGSIFIFTRSKLGASRLFRSLQSRGYRDTAQMHSDLRQSDREQALEDFKSGKYRILIATDVVGRGIHVDGVAHVINYDLPKEPEDYVHRIGRTGRAEAQGKATTFVTDHDRQIIKQLEKMLSKKIIFEK